MSTVIYGLAKSETQAAQIGRRLIASGFSANDVSALYSDREGLRELGHHDATKAPEGAAAGAGTGAAVGGVLGFLAGIGTLAIPGVGPLIAAGPILATLSGLAVGGTVGGLTGALVGAGIPEYEAQQYEGKLREGNILIAVHADTDEKTTAARRVLTEEKAESISTGREASVPSSR